MILLKHPLLYNAVWCIVLLLCIVTEHGCAQLTDGQHSSAQPPTQSHHTSPTTAAGTLSAGNTAREGHISPGGSVQLRSQLSLRRYTSISVKTCSAGAPLLYQLGAEGDSMALTLAADTGVPELTLQRLGSELTVSAPVSVTDNEWHHIYIRFSLGVLTLGVDDSLTPVLNSTGPHATFLDLNLWSTDPILYIGGTSFSGCVLEGARTPLSQPEALHEGVQWGECPLPLGRNCSGYLTDPCYSAPCGTHGRCVLTPAGDASCDCYTRYQGPTCDIDTGPLCGLQSNACYNGGLCQEDWLGNSTSCACPAGYTGLRCERTVVQECQTNPCENGGVCEVSLFQDTIECLCPAGVWGQYCENQIDECASNPCLHGGSCTDLTNDFSCDCHGTGYRGVTCSVNVNECAEYTPCNNTQAVCYDLYGGYECDCPPGYTGTHCDQVVQACSSSPCLNGGECVDQEGGDFTCRCPRGYEGNTCQVNIDDCRGVLCPANSFCDDGVSEYTCRCNLGFSGTPPNCSQIDDCDSNPCLNGATCFDESNAFTCVCPAGFTGPLCEVNIDECSGSPCLNGGTCLDGVGAHSCSCTPGFTGTNCEHNIDECELRLCQHATSCTDTVGGYECECEAGWEGLNCDTDINECSPGPCLNGATCIDRVNAFMCSCAPGYTGPTCSVDRDECAGVTCLNGGTCIDGVNNYTCACSPAYTGLHCADPYDACSSHPCQNGANCITTQGDEENDPSFYCECAAGFEGSLCSNNVNECIGVVCPEGRVCIDLINGHECQCPAGYTGDACLQEIDECQDQPCLNGGTCHDAVANFTCTCPPGFTGHTCETDVNECEQTPGLCNNGICENQLGTYQCYCRPGFSGDHCNLEFDECLSFPCRNNATCRNEINRYECICQPGYTGMNCETDIDECEVQPCHNGATCIDLVAAFSCVCVPGFTDSLCSTNIDECEPQPCENGGQCHDGINSYTCNCSDTGFKGDQCEINIDDCEPEPCQHGGNCSDLVKDYSCSCFEGYTGKDCEIDVPECDSGPCLNGGSCYERSDLSLYGSGGVFTNFSYNTAGGYECHCVAGFTGHDCEINIDECESSPCVHGACIDGINAYSCSCEPGYMGDNCEIEIDECEMYTPCDQGTCEDQVADYDCQCYSGFGGKNCSVALIGCENVNCLNGGSCEPLLYNETEHDFKCHCEPGFTGRHCSHSTTFSLSGTSSHVVVTSTPIEGYSLELWFRTTLPSGIIAIGEGQTYYTLQLSEGRLNLQSSLINEWDGIFVGEGLNTGDWQRVGLLINETNVVLIGGQDMYVHSITPEEHHTTFTTTFIGGVTPTLRTLSNTPSFIGCIQDASVNSEVLIPSQLPQQAKVNTMDGCPRTEQCDPNPCHNGGRCVDLWTTYECNCRRPYIGDTCLLSFTAATFGNEAVRDSLVTVGIPASDAATFRTHLDVSLLVRTRQSKGMVFYIGTHVNSTGSSSYLLCSVSEGSVMVTVMLGGAVERFVVPGAHINDGEPHLLQVARRESELKVFIDEMLRLNQTLTVSGDFTSEVMYLGGLPHTPLPASLLDGSLLSRAKRQLGTGVITDTSDNNGNDALTSNSFNTDLFTTNSFGPQPTGDTLGSLPDSFATGPVGSNNLGISDLPASSSVRPSVDPFTFSNTFISSELEGESGFMPTTFPAGPSFASSTSSAISSFPPTTQSIASDFDSVSSSTPQTFIPGPIHFKGIMQDVRVSNGTVTRLVQPFILRPIDGEDFVLPGSSLNNTILHNVLEGTVSDAACDSNPCQNGATCEVTWNDYKCTCTFGFKGKDCDELEFCQRYGCPEGATCVNLIDGFECLSDLTMNGVNSSVDFTASFSEPPPTINVVSVGFRSQVGGMLLYIEKSLASVQIGLAGEDQVVVKQTNLSQTVTTVYTSPSLLDGEWHTVNITFDLGLGVLVSLDNATLTRDTTPEPTIVNFKNLVLGGNIRLGAGQNLHPGSNLIQESYFDSVSTVAPLDPAHYFRGCLREVRVGHVLLPAYSPDLLSQDSAANKFVRLAASQPETGCRVCFETECENGGHCTDPEDTYTCSCPIGFSGSICQTNIDDCVDHMCENGAFCRDGINEYHCECAVGYMGRSCEIEINECESQPCLNGGSCNDGIGEFVCTCTEEYIGPTCSELKINNCSSNKCQNSVNCIDLYLSPESQRTGIADNYTCECLFGFTGHNCDRIIDYCGDKNCNFGDCILTYREPGWECSCRDGYEGRHCDTEINECESNPCQNGGTCVDHFLRVECQCPEGWQGEFCGLDVNECDNDPCMHGTCVNLNGTFNCLCPQDYCGQTCSLDSPCLVVTCQHNGVCVPDCNEDIPFGNNTMPLCECTSEWEGQFCENAAGLGVAMIVGIVIGVLFITVVVAVGLFVLCMMTKKKRATRGTYSPSRQEFYSPRMEMGNAMKPPPEERLI